MQKSTKMIDVSEKFETLRFARATGKIRLPREIVKKIEKRQIKKGDVLSVSQIAGIIGAKHVPQLIPLCHPVPIDSVEINLDLEDDGILVEATVKGIGRTGYEIEAITAVSVALINIYDMCKAYTEEMHIEEIRLVEKGGGKSDWYEDLKGLKAAVIVASDSVSAGKAKDKSGEAVKNLLQELGTQVIEKIVVPDEKEVIKDAVLKFREKADLIFVVGGTGLSPRDVTPEASKEIIEKEIPGLSEATRIMGAKYTPRALLSRAKVGLIKEGVLLINLPGSEKGAIQTLSIIAPLLKHAIKMSKGGKH